MLRKAFLIILSAILIASPAFAFGSHEESAVNADGTVDIDLWYGAAVTEAGPIPEDWAGYDIIRDFDGVMKRFDELLGLSQIAVFHINDSKNMPGAAKDRHENIGFGHIGFEALNRIVHDERFVNVPKILETPYIPDGRNGNGSSPPYNKEIEMLRNGIVDTSLKEETDNGKN